MARSGGRVTVTQFDCNSKAKTRPSTGTGRAIHHSGKPNVSGIIVDVHPHIVSKDTKKYPPTPLFGIQSDWSKERPANVEDLLAEMDRAGVAKTAIVHASTVYGFDNSLVEDAVKRFPARCTGVGSIDMLAPDAAATAKNWLSRGFDGLRIFTGGSTKKVDASSLDDPRSYPVWEVMNERGLSMVIQTDPSGIPATIALAKRFPRVPVLVDHLGRPDVSDGAPFAKAAPLFSMAATPNIYLKYTTPAINRFAIAKIDTKVFLSKLVGEFGAGRIAWGSNWPNDTGTLAEHVAMAKAGIAHLSPEDQDLIMGGTALKVYPSLQNK